MRGAKTFLWGAVVACGVLQAGDAWGQAHGLMRLSTLEWPPYTGTLLPGEGLSTKMASMVAKAAGYKLMTASFEWATTVEKGEKAPNFDGYFPEYYTKEREQNCHLSQAMGSSVLGIATLKSNTINWSALSDLADVRLGVVDGYSNGEAFDQAVADKRQKVELVPSDAANVGKLSSGKIRGIVIDQKVLDYTLAHLGGADRIVFGSKPIAELTLHVCFKKTPAGLAMRNAFDAALKTVDRRKVESDYSRLVKGNW
jgi:polar amino acid transport system substrate-binding protein